MTPGKDKGQLEIALAVLEEKVDSFCERLEKIENNHLPHIQEELTSIKIRMAYYNGAGVIVIAIVQFLINWLFK